MSAFKDHMSHHRSHMLGCAVAALLVIIAVVFSVPFLAIAGVALCGGMMFMMVWMMLSMASRTHR